MGLPISTPIYIFRESLELIRSFFKKEKKIVELHMYLFLIRIESILFTYRIKDIPTS